MLDDVDDDDDRAAIGFQFGAPSRRAQLAASASQQTLADYTPLNATKSRTHTRERCHSILLLCLCAAPLLCATLSTVSASCSGAVANPSSSSSSSSVFFRLLRLSFLDATAPQGSCTRKKNTQHVAVSGRRNGNIMQMAIWAQAGDARKEYR